MSAKLIKVEAITPAELRSFGKRVTIFTAEKADDEYQWERYKGKVNIVSVPRLPNEEWSDHIRRIQHKVEEMREAYPCEFYTGIHKENDWSRTYIWDKGWHICNRTGDYAVVTQSALDKYLEKVDIPQI